MPDDQYAAAMQLYSIYSGYLSIMSWLFAQIPQVLKNYREKDVAGLSGKFLTAWFLGDILNFTSCFLNEAMLFQYLLSGYYCMIDVVLAGQFIYYTYYYDGPRYGCSVLLGPTSPALSVRSSVRHKMHTDTEIPLRDQSYLVNTLEADVEQVVQTSTARQLLQTVSAKSSAKKFAAGAGNAAKFAGKMLVFLPKAHAAPIGIFGAAAAAAGPKQNNSFIHRLLDTWRETDNGKLFGWASAAFYVLSRIPQMITNIRIQTTAGISLKLVLFALIGNLFYAISIVTSGDALMGGDITSQFWRDELCYFVGAVGTVCFDTGILLQWLYYDIVFYEQRYFREKDDDTDTDEDNGVQMAQRSKPIKFCAPPAAPLSPKHMHKLSEQTPLTPIDFLLDDYYEEPSYHGSDKSHLASTASSTSPLARSATHSAGQSHSPRFFNDHNDFESLQRINEDQIYGAIDDTITP